MNKSPVQFLVFAILIVVGFAGVFGLSNYLERNRVSLPESYEDTDLSLQGKQLKGFALGAEGLMADWYWMQSLQYLGSKLIKSETELVDLNDLRRLNPRLLYPYLDNATDLDPKLIAAYTFGATMLPAIDNDQAIALAQKGIAANPESWNLHHLLGYIYWTNKDYDKAAKVYDDGIKIEGAPQFMKIMAAALRTQGGSRETARAMFAQMLASNPDQQTRSNAEFRLMELDWLDERDAINPILKTFEARQGRCPSRTSDLVPLLRGVKLPAGNDFSLDSSDSLVDPTGVPYVIDTAACAVQLGTASTLPRQEQ